MRYLLLLLPIVAAAQPVITIVPKLHYKTDSQASFYFETAGTASPYCRWGTSTGVYGFSQFRDDSNTTTHAMYITGLPANTTIYYQCGASTGSSCNEGVDCTMAAEQTFVTDNISRPYEPTAPDESWSTSINTAQVAPNSDEWNGGAAGWSGGAAGGRIVTMNSSCKRNADGTTTLQAVLDAVAALNSADNFEVRIPAGAVCYGRFDYNARTNHTGYLITRTATAYGEIPPEGTQTSDNWAHTMPIIRANVFYGSRQALSFLAGTCRQGQGDANLSRYPTWDSGQSTGFPLYYCMNDVLVAPSSVTISAYDSGTSTFTTSSAHGLVTGNLAEISATGLSLDSTSAARHIIRVSDTQFQVQGVTITGTCTGCGGAAIVQEMGNFTTPAIAGILSTGSGNPSNPCTDGNYYQDTSIVTNYLSGWFCSGSTWYPIQFQTLSTGDTAAAIRVNAGAKKLRFVGIKVDKVPGQTTVTNYLLSDRVNFTSRLINVDYELTEDIIFDRIIVDGLGYPTGRMGEMILLNGKRAAFINSVARNATCFLSTTISGNFEAYAIVVHGPGPGRIENNYLEAAGINIFWPDATIAATPSPVDYVVRRNYIVKNLATMKGHVSNSADLYYYNRHNLELKKGVRFKITGNKFLWNYAATNQGAMIALTPQTSSASLTSSNNFTMTGCVNGVCTLASPAIQEFVDSYAEVLLKISGTSGGGHDGLWSVASVSGSTVTLNSPPTATDTGGTMQVRGVPWRISDINIGYNTFGHAPVTIITSGYNTETPLIKPQGFCCKMKFHNNTFFDINASAFASGGWVADTPGSQAAGETTYAATSARGTSNTWFFRNAYDSFINSGSNEVNLAFVDATQETRGDGTYLNFSNNIVSTDAADGIARCCSPILRGTAALDDHWTISGSPSWVFANNWIPGNVASNQPSGNTYSGTIADIKWMDTASRDYRLMWNSAKRGLGIGPNVEDMNAEQGHVSNVRVRRVTSSPVISYTKPDNTACSVEYGTSATWGTGTRTADGGTARNVDVSVTLTANTDYVRLMCATEQFLCTESGSAFTCEQSPTRPQ